MASERALSRAVRLGALLAALSGAAHAEPDETAKETARNLMAEGRDARDRNDLKLALARFTAADAIMHVPTTTLEVGKTQAALGLLVEARDTLHNILRDPNDAAEPPAFAHAREGATALDQELVLRIPVLRLVLSGVSAGGARVRVDGEPVPELALASGYRLNPGAHRIVADTEVAHAERNFQLGESETQEFELELEPRTTEHDPPLVNSPAQAGAYPGSASQASHVPVVPIMLGGVSLVALGSGVSFGLVGKSRKHQLESGCAPDCTPASVARVQTMYTFANVSFSVSLVAAASAFVWYALVPSSASAPRRASAGRAPLKLQDFRVDVGALPSGLDLALRARF